MIARMFASVAWVCLLATFTQAADAVLVYFHSPACGPCRRMDPVLDQMADTGVPIRRVDVSRESSMAARHSIRSTPTFVMVKNGREISRSSGMQTADQLWQRWQNANRVAPATRTSASYPNRPATAGSRDNGYLGGQPSPSLDDPPGFARDRRPAVEAQPSIALADAIQRAEAATVRIRVYDGYGFGVGTGTVIDTHGDDALVMTCGHLFRDTNGEGRIEVDVFYGGETRTVAGTVIDFDAENRDIAVLEMKPGVPIDPVALGDAPITTGTAAFSFGCDRGADPSRRDTRITGVDKYNQHLGSSNLEIDGAPIDGRSGGGLFDAEGRLIGVCNAADYDDDIGIYAAFGEMRWQLDRIGMAKLYQNPTVVSAPETRLASLPSHPSMLGHQDPPAMNTPVNRMDLSPREANPRRSSDVGSPNVQELIVILRGPDGTDTQTRTIRRPTAELLRAIETAGR